MSVPEKILKGHMGRTLTSVVGWEWVLPAGLRPPGSQQFGGVPIGLDEANKIPLTGKVSAAQGTADGPGGGSEGQCGATPVHAWRSPVGLSGPETTLTPEPQKKRFQADQRAHPLGNWSCRWK